jgi:hypothetical protein
MSTGIEITKAQAKTLASLSRWEGPLAIRQLAADEGTGAAPGDIYVTPRGAASGFRIASDGTMSDIGETLPAPA